MKRTPCCFASHSSRNFSAPTITRFRSRSILIPKTRKRRRTENGRAPSPTKESYPPTASPPSRSVSLSQSCCPRRSSATMNLFRNERRLTSCFKNIKKQPGHLTIMEKSPGRRSAQARKRIFSDDSSFFQGPTALLTASNCTPYCIQLPYQLALAIVEPIEA